MGDFGIQRVSAALMQADLRRFGSRRAQNLIKLSGLDVSVETVQAYCRWFVGSDFDWKSDWGQRRIYGPSKSRRKTRKQTWADTMNTGQIADFLAGATSQGGEAYSFHTLAKQGRTSRGSFHWTPFLGVDLDVKSRNAHTLRARYDACRQLLGTPLVIQSPNKGLHLFWPLLVPVSVIGFVAKGDLPIPVLMPTLFAAAGLRVSSGEIEFLPTHKRTLRLPYPEGGEQLDPSSLASIAFPNRSARIESLVHTMSELARTSPLNVLALAGRTNSTPPSHRTSTSGFGSRNLEAPKVGPDCQRLLEEGLYLGVKRHEACLVLARHWMQQEGRNVDQAIAELMHWTATMTNGLSHDAADIENATTSGRLVREYTRMCRGIEQFMLSKGRTVGTPSSRRAFLTDDESQRVLAAGLEFPNLNERYWQEVFLCCLLGFAKRFAKSRTRSGDRPNVLLAQVELAASAIQKWPRCGGGSYHRRLGYAVEGGFCRLTRQYQLPRLNARGRARTYEFCLDALGSPLTSIDPVALLQAVERVRVADDKRIHPQQIEHALLAHAQFPETLAARYGHRNASRIKRLRAVYLDCVTEVASRSEAA